VWDGRDREGFPFLGHFPPSILAGKNDTEIKLTLANGSIVQFVGSDNIDSLMSTNLLRKNGGWAVFDYTPRGRKHGYELFNLASKLVEDGDPSGLCSASPLLIPAFSPRARSRARFGAAR